jgi:hypothetical protein
MLDCLIVGDSIAVGVAQYRPECVSYARVGITSKMWNDKFLTRIVGSETTIISLGSNDWNADTTLKEVMALREVVNSKRVFWIMPSIKPEIRYMIQIVADKYDDDILYVRETSKDNVHPTNAEYKRLAKEAK